MEMKHSARFKEAQRGQISAKRATVCLKNNLVRLQKDEDVKQ